jgi:hypothetical protein
MDTDSIPRHRGVLNRQGFFHLTESLPPIQFMISETQAFYSLYYVFDMEKGVHLSLFYQYVECTW